MIQQGGKRLSSFLDEPQAQPRLSDFLDEPSIGSDVRDIGASLGRGVFKAAGGALESVGEASRFIDKYLFNAPGATAEEDGQYATTRYGQALRQFGEEQFPRSGHEGFWTGDLPENAAALLPMAASGGAAALAEGSATTAMALTATGQAAADTYADAVAHGADPEGPVALKAFLGGGAIGGTTATVLPGILGHAFKGPTGKVLREVLIEGAKMGGLGVLQDVAGNLLAENLYDEDRPLLEGALKSGELGFLTGVAASALTHGVGRVAHPPADEALSEAHRKAQGPIPVEERPKIGAPEATPAELPTIEQPPATRHDEPPASQTLQEAPGEALAQGEPEAVREPERVQESAGAQGGAAGEEQAPKAASTEEPKLPATPEEEAQAILDGPVSLKYRLIDQNLAEMGHQPSEHAERLSDETANDEARATLEQNPNAGHELLESLKGAERPITKREGAILLREINRLRNARAEAARMAKEAYAANDDAMRAEAVRREQRIRADYKEAGDILTRVGTHTAQSLAFRRALMKADYSLESMKLDLETSKGGAPLTAEESAQVEALHQRLEVAEKGISEIEAKQKTLEAENAMLRLKREVAARQRSGGRQARVKAIDAEITTLLHELASGTTARGGAVPLDPATIGKVFKLAKLHIEKGVIKFAEFAEPIIKRLGEHIRPHLEAAWKKAQDERRSELAKPIAERLRAGGEATHYMNELARGFIEQGVTEREPLIDAVHDVLKEADPSITREQARDALSGYGRFRPASKEDVDVRLRQLKGEMQKVAQIEALEKKAAPLKSGFDRGEPSDEYRRLTKKANELKKQTGIGTPSPEEHLKSAQQAVERRLANQISDLQYEIDQKKLIVREQAKVDTTPEIQALEAQRDALKEEHARVFKKESDAKRLGASIASVKKSISDYEKRIAEKDLAVHRGEPGATSAELEALKARRESLAQELRNLRTAANPKASPEERALAAYSTRQKNAIARLRERMARGDFGPPKKKEMKLGPEQIKLKAEHETARREYERLKEKQRLADRSTGERVKDAAREALNLTKAVRTAWDDSAVFRQAAMFTLDPSRIATTGKNILASLRAFGSETKAREMEVAIGARPNAELAKRAGLDVTHFGDDIGPREEAIRSALSDKIPGIRASNRAFTTFMNLTRATAFDSFVDAVPGAPTDVQAKALANAVNVLSGRGAVGKGRAAAAVHVLSDVLWSPRLLLSRFQLLLGQPFYRGDFVTRKIIAKQYARSLAGVATLYALVKLYKASTDDDDVSLTFDPRSSDFGKVKIGNTRVDPLAGLSQILVLGSRLASGEKKTASGNVVPIRGDAPYGAQDAADIIENFVRSKLSPTISAPVDLLSGKDVTGTPVTLKSALIDAAIPMAVGDVYKAMLDRGIPEGTALGILSVFGMGLQTYEPKQKKGAF